MKTIVLYTGEICSPCRMLKTVLESQHIPYEQRNGKDYADIISVPTVDFLEDGEVKQREVGANGSVVKKIKDWLSLT